MLLCYLVSEAPGRVCLLVGWLIAMSVSGGKIFVFTGILPVCKNDDGLASVMGHGESVAKHQFHGLQLIPKNFGLLEIAHQGKQILNPSSALSVCCS